jgi:geranylgeranyl reductase family protein
MVFDVAIVGGGPAGSTCAACCAAKQLPTLVIEREKFPREKVCGDCLNPDCWPILRQLNLEEQVRNSSHRALDYVEFIGLRERAVRVPLPAGAEIALKRSLFDTLLLERARELGAQVREETTLSSVKKNEDEWKLITADATEFRARILVAADGRNSTVARLLGLLPRVAKERVALQAHVPLPRDFGNRVILQLLPGGYSGQAPVSEHELNVCLVGKASGIAALRNWAIKRFDLPPGQTWRTITPLTRAPLPAAGQNLLLCGDATRVVEPFTGEGIFYAMRSGELAAAFAVSVSRGSSSDAARDYAAQHAAMYKGRLWINGLARAAVVSPQLGSFLLELGRFQPTLLRYLTGKIVR